ncbi:hypothetical protein [Kitasatospora herbaricolor]|uniref:Uncharacterized protein n=1 Tax=Kitasatospora herbaricolor TaxID=68217 RepID=A0ABZ1W5B8_9ACTN|nr:hypothetical protein [Kitasatospora herbaricolor]
MNPQPPGGEVPPLFRGLFDDAAVFPPGDLPLVLAVPAHRAHRTAWYAAAVGPFLCGAARLGELPYLTEVPLRVGIVLPGGSATLPAALRTVTGFEPGGIRLAGVELGGVGPTAADVRAAVEALDAHLPAGVPAAVELPRGAGLEASLDVLAGTPYRAKFRTGGLSAEAFPDEEELAGFLAGCAERGIPYKCTAGLHHAVRHTDPATGFEHHGFLNVLLAAFVARQDGREGAALALRERSGGILAGAASALTGPQVELARASFTAFGTCSIAEPLDDLAGLGLLTPPAPPPLEDR